MSQNSNALNEALRQILARLRDVSLRDGIQSWDGNKWHIADILAVAKELNTFARVVHDTLDVALPTVEAWGGEQVAGPARVLRENPLDNLRQLRDAMPNIQIRCLYRGRQGFGKRPLSHAIQSIAIRSAIESGVRVFNIFDMMKDARNYSASLDILNHRQAEQPDEHVICETAIPYINEPQGRRAWELTDYGALAVELAKQNPGVRNETAIKDYIGGVDGEVVELLGAIRSALDAAGFKNRRINLHTHGDKPNVLVKALFAGADRVDVAIGELAGGPSHTNMRSIIYKLLEGQFAEAEIDAHPVMQQLAKVEQTISEIVHDKNKSQTPGKSFYELRERLRKIYHLSREYRIASGALSDLDERVRRQYPNHPDKADALFQSALNEFIPLWERGGRFDTVTPGSKILTDQAIRAVLKKPHVMTMSDYTPEYLDVITDRYGENMGMKKGVGDVNFRDGALMYRALGVINQAIEKDQIGAADFSRILWKAELGCNGNRLRCAVKNGRKLIDLSDETLEMTLTTQDSALTLRPIERLRAAIENSGIADDIKERVLSELTPGRSPEPAESFEIGYDIVTEMMRTSSVNCGGEEVTEELALLAILLRDIKNGYPDDAVIKGIIEMCPIDSNPSPRKAA